MTGIEKYNSPAKTQRLGNDSVYGFGTDGNVVIASNTSLSRDMYYNNLTINIGSHLNTNGYKVFVRGTLAVNGSIGVNSDITVSIATLSGTSNIASNTTNSIGGNAAGVTYTASQVPSYLIYAIENALSGGYINTSGVFNAITGGAGGENGALGTVTPGANGTGATAGSSGALNRNAGVPGGPGTSGTNGVAGSTPPAAAAGAGARGGAVVLVCAKTITGTGTIMSRGSSATAGGSSATGSGATNGAAGSPAPSATLTHLVNSHAHYRTGDGTTGPHAQISAPALPRTALPFSASANHAHGFWAYTEHGATPAVAHGAHHGSNPHHGGATTSHAPVAPAADYFHINGIDHAAGSHLGHDGAVAHYFNVSPTLGHNHYHQVDHHTAHVKGSVVHTSAHRTRHDLHGSHANGVARQGGDIRSQGSSPYAGGNGGSAGTPGTNGSTTAGTNGRSGGGGGIIIVTDTSSLPCQTSVIGGTIGGVSGSSGSVITIVNT